MNIIDDLSHCLQRINGRNTRRQQCTHSPCKLCTGSLYCQLAKQGHLHLHLIDGKPALFCPVDHLICHDHQNDQRQDNIPVCGHPLTGVHNPHGDSRHFHIQICKHINKDWYNEQKHDSHNSDRSNDQDDRVDGCLSDRRFQLGFLLKLYCHSRESHLQTTGVLTSFYHIDEHRRKYILLTSHGIRQCITFFHTKQNFRDRTLEPFILRLL